LSRALVTDLYELNMATSYLPRGIVGPATFGLLVRKLPPRRGFLVAAGLEDCLAFWESFAFANGASCCPTSR
jgi:nicotinate phosphoribosyltransferase